jgi:uncharacterized membrane protein YphA (DoxX/SURF4 family)
MNKNTLPYALGAMLLGIVGIFFHDFALTWQPVPSSVGMRVPLAYLSGAILVIGGGAILTGKGVRLGAWILTIFFGFWVVALHIPNALAGWQHIGAWNGPAELTFATMGGLALVSANAGDLKRPMALVARVVAGICALVFGFAHFNYIDFTATMVPQWLPPNGEFWAMATGAGHLAAGLALVSGVKARLAATCLAGMMASFVLLVHLPGVWHEPASHLQWAMLAVATTFTGAAWLVRKYST